MPRSHLSLALGMAATILALEVASPTPAAGRWWDYPKSGYCPAGTCNKIGGWRALNVRNCSAANCVRQH